MGRVTRAHGLKGEVTVLLTTDRTERLAVGSVLSSSRGALEVVASRPFKDRFLVTFKGVNDRESADALQGTALLAEPIDDPDEMWVHELIGCRVIGIDGTDRGTVISLEANPASDLLVLDDGRLVPLVFVVEHDVAGGVLRVDTPDGLFDL